MCERRTHIYNRLHVDNDGSKGGQSASAPPQAAGGGLRLLSGGPDVHFCIYIYRMCVLCDALPVITDEQSGCVS